MIPQLFFYKIKDRMNRVSPIIEEIFDCSADSFQSKNLPEPKGNIGSRFVNQGELRTCKICLQEQQVRCLNDISTQDSEGQLIVPCECSGSVGFVHQKCIREWIKRQLSETRLKRAFCEICKSQIFFKKRKFQQCECKLSNCLQTSPCNIVCLIIQLVILGILGVIQYYIVRSLNFPLLRDTIYAVIGVVTATFALTIVLILKDVFVKNYKEVDRIYSLAETQQLGLREPVFKKSVLNMAKLHKKSQIKKKKSPSIFRAIVTYNCINPAENFIPTIHLQNTNINPNA